MPSHMRAILWAEWRSLVNFRPRGGGWGFALAGVMALFWYGLWLVMSVGAHSFAATAPAAKLAHILPRVLMFVLFYWQLSPVLSASLGVSLALEKLLIYPIPFRQLFTIEVLLRLSTSLEVVILLCGISTGLARNAAVPAWAPLLALPLYGAFNLLLSAGLRQALERVLARRRLREALLLVLILCAALPQLLLVTGVPVWLSRLFAGPPLAWWPWTVTAKVALGARWPLGWMVLIGLLVLAWWYGRWQFTRSLRFDARAQSAGEYTTGDRSVWIDRFFRWPALVFPDPLAALLEKELRSLARTPRFRLVFLMGFTFGPLIWMPMSFGQGVRGDSLLVANYLTMVSAYALVLLGDVTFWNTLGLDRSAAQLYYLLPAPFARVLAAKNLAAVFVILVEVTVVTLACLALRMPFSGPKIVEAYAVTLVLSVYLLAMGNLSSVYYPVGVHSEKSWRPSSPARMRALLFALYPIAAMPVLLAYLARYAFSSGVAFYLVLVVAAVLGAVVYSVAMDSATEAAGRRKEQILSALGEGSGAVGV
jgi:ABC-2 type transport system permease protein